MAKPKLNGDSRAPELAWIPLLAAIPAFFVYRLGLHNPFVYDDLITVVANPSLRPPLRLKAVLLHDLFRPVVNLSYAADSWRVGIDPFGFHLTSLILHLLAVVLLVSVFRLLIDDAGGCHQERLLSLLLAALWGVHPLLSESVAYVSGRSELLCGVFFLAGLLSLRRAVDGGRLWTPFGLLLFSLALASKEVAIVFPLLWWLWDSLLRPGDQPARARRARVLHLPFVMVVAMLGLVRVGTLLRVEATAVAPWGSYVAGQLVVAWRYLGLLVLPRGLSVVHDVGEPEVGRVLVAAAAWLALAALAWRFRHRVPLAALGLGWWVLLLAPSSGVPLAEAMAEHRSYLATIGPLLVVAELLRRSDGPRARRAVPLVLVVLIAWLSVLTARRVEIWGDPVALWRDAASKAPRTWAPHYALGDELLREGRCGEAIEAYRAAIEILPGEELRAYMNLGICLAREQRHEEAEAIFRKALEYDPGYTKAYNNLAQLAQIRRDPLAAVELYRKAAELDPGNVPARLQLARLYEGTFGSRALALQRCREVIEIEPGNQDARHCVQRLESAQAGP